LKEEQTWIQTDRPRDKEIDDKEPGVTIVPSFFFTAPKGTSKEVLCSISEWERIMKKGQCSAKAAKSFSPLPPPLLFLFLLRKGQKRKSKNAKREKVGGAHQFFCSVFFCMRRERGRQKPDKNQIDR
jgi:hypothetical protein